MILFEGIVGRQMNLRYKGGGSSTGAVEHPSYMEDRHDAWLGTGSVTKTVSSLINDGLGTNPLESLEYTDPSSDIGEIESEYDSWNTEVDGLDEESDWESMVSAAVAQVDTAGVLNDINISSIITSTLTGAGAAVEDAVAHALESIDTAIFDDAVQAYADSRSVERSRLRTRYKAGMANIGTERSSAYAMGMALLESEFERETGQFASELGAQALQQSMQMYAQAFRAELTARIQSALSEKQTRDQVIVQGVGHMLQYKQFMFELKRSLVSMIAEIKRIGVVSDSEYVGNTADLNWKYAQWDWNVYASATGVLGGIGGGTFVPEGPTKTSSALGGALSGAGTGAALGSVVPGLGTAVGAGVGAVVGGLAGLF